MRRHAGLQRRLRCGLSSRRDTRQRTRHHGAGTRQSLRPVEGGIRPHGDRCDAGLELLADHFTTGGDPNGAYRVVVIFNPPPTAGGPTLCTRPETADAIAGDLAAPRVPMVAALCRGDYYMSLAAGTVAAPGGARDAEFRTGIGLVTAALFPAQNPQRTGRSECNNC